MKLWWIHLIMPKRQWYIHFKVSAWNVLMWKKSLKKYSKSNLMGIKSHKSTRIYLLDLKINRNLFKLNKYKSITKKTVKRILKKFKLLWLKLLKKLKNKFYTIKNWLKKIKLFWTMMTFLKHIKPQTTSLSFTFYTHKYNFHARNPSKKAET